MADSNERKRRLAENITDQRSIDWERELASAKGASRGVRGLKLVEGMARAHREFAAHSAPEEELFRWGSLSALERIGQGSYGDVYRAWEPNLGIEVALKLRVQSADEPSGGAAERAWLTEAQSLAKIRHPHVLRVYGAAVHDGRAGLWTELIRGETLEDWIAVHGPVSSKEAALIGQDLCAALAAVHEAAIVHGDVKTANVMREEGGRIVLMDLGSSQSLGGAGGWSLSALSAAPERLRGEYPTLRSDLYSLGVLLYRLATGEYPFEADDADDLRKQHETSSAIPVRSRRATADRPFAAVVEHALSVDPQARFASAAELESALGQCLVSKADPVPAATTTPRRNRTLLGALVMVGLAAIAAMIIPRLTPPSTSPSGSVSENATLDVRAQVYRVTSGGREDLTPESVLSPGDRLALNFANAEPSWTYVLNEDTHGRVYVLFPILGLAPSNPLPSGSHRLPGGSDNAFDWVVTSEGERERLLIIASREPLEELEAQLRSFEPVQPGRPVRYGQFDPGRIRTLRGIGGLEPSVSGDGNALAAIAAGLAELPNQGVWVQQLEFENAAP